VAEETVAALADQIRTLYAAGARNFIVVDLPNLGQTPMVLHNNSYEPVGVTSQDGRRVQFALKLTELTAYHNSHLAKAMSQLAGELSGARLVLVDINRIVELMRKGCAPDGSCRFDFGFAAEQLRHEIKASGHTVRVQERCYQGGFLGTSDPAKVCPEAARAVFWDALHPGTYAHCWLAGFFQMEMVRAGFLKRAPSSEEYRAFCQGGIPQPESALIHPGSDE
jgi:phospholipase/lecithinase/hemolysin